MSLKKVRTFDDWLEGGPLRPQKNSLSLDWSLATVQTAFTIPTLDYYTGPTLDAHAISVVFGGLAQCDSYLHDVCKVPVRDVFRAGVISLVPQTATFESRWDKPMYAGIIRFHHSSISELGRELLRVDPDKIDFPLKFTLSDPLLYQLSLAMLQELEQIAPCGSLYADSLATTMILHILKRYSSQPKRSFSAKGKLSPEQKYRLEEYIDTHLHLKISLPELANIMHMSVPHISRLFAPTYGMPVYKYIMTKRVERAKVLLIDKNRSLLDVALDCGFANQSHFNHQFKQIVGISPGQYAREMS